MILIEKTIQEFGYDPTNWVPQRFKVWCRCDYCNREYVTKGGYLHNAAKNCPLVPKHACKKRACKIAKATEGQKLAGTYDEFIAKKETKKKETIIKKFGTYEAYCLWLSEKEKKKWENSTDSEKKIRMESLNNGLQKFLDENEVTSAFKLGWVWDKIKETNLELYDTEHPIQLKEVSSKAVESRKRTWEALSPEEQIEWKRVTKENHMKSMMENHGVPYNMQCPEIVDKSRQSRLNNGNCHNWDGRTARQWQLELNVDYRVLKPIYENLGVVGLLNYKKNRTKIEHIMGTILKQNDLLYLPQKRLEKFHPDFIIPDFNLIIECDGMYWHTEKFYAPEYHIKKQNTYTRNNYSSLFFREDEIENKLTIVESIIKKKCGKITENFNLGVIQEISKEEFITFAREHSLKRFSNTDYHCGLFKREILIAAAGFNSNICVAFVEHKDYIVENYQLKLSEFFLDALKYGNLEYFCNHRYENLQEYKESGFILGDFEQTYELADTHKIISVDEFNQLSPEKQEKWSRIFDCGHTKMKKTLDKI